MNFNFAHIKQSIQALERAKFDAFFMADHMAVLNMPMDALKRSHTSTSFEPFTLLSALSQVTSASGLSPPARPRSIAPYHIARRFASLDWISGGRAGWNIVTHVQSGRCAQFRPRRAYGARRALFAARGEFYDVVTGLWDSWADDAWVRDVEDGGLFRSGENARARSQGQIFLRARPGQYRPPIQGWPVIVQAGASDSGRQLAAETAEAVFTAQTILPSAGRSMPTSKAAWKSSAAPRII